MLEVTEDTGEVDRESAPAVSASSRSWNAVLWRLRTLRRWFSEGPVCLEEAISERSEEDEVRDEMAIW